MMDGTDVSNLLISYLLKELDSSDQEKYIIELIQNDQSLQEQCMELENLLRIIAIKENVDEIDVNEERLAFEKLRSNTKMEAIRMDTHDSAYIDETNNPSRFRKVMLSIASILLFMVAGYLVFRTNSRTASELHPNKTATNRLLPKILHESNFSGHEKTVVLEDGSIVTLSDRTEIDFPLSFASDRRDIRLSGQANFKVAKDKTRPFSVYSNHIATTALGTQFTVSNYDNELNIRVHLFEGSVVVKYVGDSLIKSLGLYYLLSGQELVYDKISSAITIKGLKGNRSQLQDNAKDGKYIDSPSMPSDKGGSWFMFNNQPLPLVFDQLSQIYGVNIKYRVNEMQKFYFIGKFGKTDSLEYILRNIATINKLTLLKEEDGYRMKK
jgi:transmembrane sensor